MKLSNDIVLSLLYEKSDNKQDVRWDEKVTGFGVRVFPSGRKTFVVAVRVSGKRHMTTIGSFPEMSVDDARVKAVEVLSRSSVSKSPPQNRYGKTFEELVGIYIQRRVNAMKSGAEERRRINKDILPRFGKKSPYMISNAEVTLMHHEISIRGKVEANRVLSVLRRIFNRGKEWGYLSPDFKNPTDHVIEHPERKRDRWVSPDEMPALLTAINNVRNVYVRALFWLYILTGARKTELMRAKWSGFDKRLKQLKLEDTKNGSTFWLHLSSDAWVLLNDLPKVNEYIFPGRGDGGSGHLTNVFKSWASVRFEAGLSDVTIHDLRRTFASWLAEEGNSLELIGKALNHESLSSTGIYARFSNGRIQTAIESNSKKIIKIAKPKM